MKKLIYIAALLLGLSNIASAQKYFNKVKITTREDSVNYGIGVILAQNILEQGFDKLNADIIGKAFCDIINNNNLVIPEESLSPLVQDYFAQIAEAEKEKAKEKEKEFLDKNAKEDGIKITESGLQYKVVKEGTGIKPTDENSVLIHYEGKLIDGTIFDSSFGNEEPVKLDMDYLIPGMTEALKMMSEGSEYIIYVPSELGYGEYSPAEIIPAYSTLIFDIELVKVTEKSDDDDEEDDSTIDIQD
jgi:FKBP-type peptidyl-prolyl cis-trans isomerase